MKYFSGYISWSGLAGSLPEFFMAYMFMVTWAYPFSYGDSMVKDLRFLIMVEVLLLAVLFFLYLFGSFVGNDVASGADWAKMLFLLISLGWAVLILGCYLVDYPKTWLIFLIWFLFFSKFVAMLGLWQMDMNRFAITGRLTVKFILYFSILSFVSCTPFPVLGIDEMVISAQSGTGLFISEPHKGLALGFLYYLSAALFEVFLSIKKPERMYD